MASKRMIFISYRRQDNISMIGRINDQLVATFGEKDVFKDMEDIPAGADFRVVLGKALDSSRIVLAIIGQHWLTMTDAAGLRRLDNPNDFVRIEIETALKHPNLVVIPVLIDNAVMPPANQLPDSLRELAYRNAMVVRNDPDFHHDIEGLTAQIKQHSGNLAVEQSRQRLVNPLVIAVLTAIIFLFMLGIVFVVRNSATSATVEPVAADEYMVLVAQPEPLRNPTPRDVARYVVEDLRRSLEQNIPFSKIRIRQYNGIIKTDDEAQKIAAANGATVIIWGNYADDSITLNVQIGTTARFPHNTIPLATLTRTANVRVKLTDERVQSVAQPVLGILVALHTGDGNGYEVSRHFAIASLLKDPSAEILGEGVSAHSHHALQLLFTDTPAALTQANQAINLDKVNPLLYLTRAAIELHQGDMVSARKDIQSAQSVGPANWLMPHYVDAMIDLTDNNLESAIAQLNPNVTERPDDWFPVYLRGAFYYLKGDYDKVRVDINRAIALKPTANFPYLFAALMALREGRFTETQHLIAQSNADFPDVTLGQRVIETTFGAGTPSSITAMFDIYGALLIRQYDEAIDKSTAAFQAGMTLPDLYLARGFAYCNQGNDTAAEADYSSGLKTDSHNVALYMLRADVRQRLQNPLGAAADVVDAQQNSEAGDMTLYIQAASKGDLTCKNLFDFAVPATQQP
ncbi:MAG: TIR domain-containing protein [Chloroflexota bacterium]